MADQNFMDLASKTASGITGTDYMMLVNNSEAYKALVNDVAEAILGKLTSKSFSGLETTAKNVIGALNELNSKTRNIALQGNGVYNAQLDDVNIDDEVNLNGFYTIVNVNAGAAPFSSNNVFALLVVGNNSIYTSQIAIRFEDCAIKVRTCHGGNWEP